MKVILLHIVLLFVLSFTYSSGLRLGNGKDEGAVVQVVSSYSPALHPKLPGGTVTHTNLRRLGKPLCGDGTCNGKESCSSCPVDCCVGPTPAPVPTFVCPLFSSCVCQHDNTLSCNSHADCVVPGPDRCTKGQKNECSTDNDCSDVNGSKCKPTTGQGTCEEGTVITDPPTSQPTNVSNAVTCFLSVFSAMFF